MISFNDIEIARLRQQLAAENTRLIALIRNGSQHEILAQKNILKEILEKINELQNKQPPKQ